MSALRSVLMKKKRRAARFVTAAPFALRAVARAAPWTAQS
jgi:hypothetical protein